MVRALALAVIALAVIATAAVAQPAWSAAGRRLAVDTPVRHGLRDAPAPPRTIYLERCAGGCTILMGDNDAEASSSTIPTSALSTVTEFANAAGQTGTAADAEWAQIVQCVQQVYSPYAVTVTDQPPTDGTSYNEEIVAGRPENLGQSSDILGIAPLANDCSVLGDVISFTFANAHPPVGHVLNVCWTAAQEAAHAFGLDHEYEFANGDSACNDPMTYRTDCGGQKFFRDRAATCGEYAARDCKCGGKQNSHQKLLTVFGAGTPTSTPPTITMTSPTASDATLAAGEAVMTSAGAQRGVDHVDLVINGFAWASVPGAAFGASGQPDPAAYVLTVPADLPDSVVDVQAIAYDDLAIATSSPVVELTKGAPCTSAASCAAGQRCDTGKCLWDPPTGELGDACSYPQFCKSLRCEGPTGGQTCAQVCSVSGDGAACGGGTTCEALAEGSDDGVCVTHSGGCCQADRGPGAGWLPAGLALLVLGVMRRRNAVTRGMQSRGLRS